MNNMFSRKIKVFFKELGVDEKAINLFLETGSPDYTTFLRDVVGAEMLEYRKSLREIYDIGHRGLILFGGNVVVITTLPDGQTAVLVQNRDDGTIGFPGGASEEWRYGEKTAVEPSYLSAYREFAEEVGETLDEDLEFIGENTSTVVYPNKDIAYVVSMFYKKWLPYEKVRHYAEGGSEEGQMALLTLKDIKNVTISQNHVPIFLSLFEEEV